ncbi:cysteine protease [Streptomyces phage Zuko]|uniref:Cysteine protease n=1 Tax=Streptomyces phage Zuko TaxID=2601695 RepID=A0A5J6D7G8_9CAUD|nr:peptidase [Streptomyces phage Zuko]QEQ93623.1 cysteine protease [Streptomyces phage Zuko]
MINARTFALGGAIAVIATAVSVVAPSAGVDSTTPSSGVSATSTVRPFPSAGTVPVVTESPESASGEINKSAERETRDESANAPYGDAERVREEARIIAEHAARLQSRNKPAAQSIAATGKKKAKPKITYIRGYSFCGWSVREAQRCIDQGKLVRYKPSGVNTLAGHNYKGWYWIDDLPTGRIVKIQSGQLKGTYKVYGHAKVYDKKFPKSGLGAAVALQTCEGSGIGFSFLRRV